ncbi:MAG: hypothetical protein JWN23_1128 [Rhodocyclales bacterium]|nr:hypothetical protein [Rhodocyclales bacterium]
MKERPILFSGPMVCALLNGTKTQTRRMVKYASPDLVDADGWPLTDANIDGAGDIRAACPYGNAGDQLWVRETFYCDHCFYPEGTPDSCHYRVVEGQHVPLSLEEKRADMLQTMYYRADGDPEFEAPEGPTPWRPSIHMPRWASRILLEVTGVRVESLQEISDADAIAEGIHPYAVYGGKVESWKGTETLECARVSPIDAYRDLWESINGEGSWDANPWVWTISFKVNKL